ncbi:3-hydroxyacyl-CoA dehydrogenase NAD-binding domain-containing protein, partial [Paraburkholderia sp. SIMBA_027]|uniref:3-hydroxyacyl-CoA dehydrogenase NAD-binding domain-containing protein n=1 Tax=Paraburkholderia sp. SIMBA_027 TaxID=3085770 RepID=UPI003979E40E
KRFLPQTHQHLFQVIFSEATGRPEKFLVLHFANEIWLNNTAEIMKHPKTDPDVFEAILEFARAIGMVALPLQKEQPGYILNSLL